MRISRLPLSLSLLGLAVFGSASVVARAERSASIDQAFHVDSRLLRPQTPEQSPPEIKELHRVLIKKDASGSPILLELPPSTSAYAGKLAGISSRGEIINLSISADLQQYTENLVKATRAPHVAIVAMDPKTGEVLALAQKSSQVPNLALYSGFPAASLFKIVTAAAAVESGGLDGNHKVSFRGGTYELEPWNYQPSPGRDRKSMSITEAIGKSCNPVFGRLALRFVGTQRLRSYAQKFAFDQDLLFDMPLRNSEAIVPTSDFHLARTGAGFGEVTISPVHAATLMAAIANNGVVLRPTVVSSIQNGDGSFSHRTEPAVLGRAIQPETANHLLEMLESTTTSGTSRKAFYRQGKPRLPFRVAAKTGTLRGSAPAGINHWFISAHPIENPRLALAVVVVSDGSYGARASELGRLMIQRFEGISSELPAPPSKKIIKKAKKRSGSKRKK